MKKMNDRHKMPTAHSGTFACLNKRSTVSQAKEQFFGNSIFFVYTFPFISNLKQ
jgi:hypothetical protein